MKSYKSWFFIPGLVLFALAACATAKPVPSDKEQAEDASPALAARTFTECLFTEKLEQAYRLLSSAQRQKTTEESFTREMKKFGRTAQVQRLAEKQGADNKYLELYEMMMDAVYESLSFKVDQPVVRGDRASVTVVVSMPAPPDQNDAATQETMRQYAQSIWMSYIEDEDQQVLWEKVKTMIQAMPRQDKRINYSMVWENGGWFVDSDFTAIK